jgi:NTP pyrophosphatase (non-canonical NTP hydrolase)
LRTDFVNNVDKIVSHFGLLEQLKKLKEEVGELFEAVISGNNLHTLEELADVKVVLLGIDRAVAFDDNSKYRVLETMQSKVDRTLNRIESGYYEKRGK